VWGAELQPARADFLPAPPTVKACHQRIKAVQGYSRLFKAKQTRLNKVKQGKTKQNKANRAT
jgi:hypothetical protein